MTARNVLNEAVAALQATGVNVSLASDLAAMRDIVESAFLIEQLRRGDGATVTVVCDNPDFDGPNNAVEICADWTCWETLRFTGDTLNDALWKAVGGPAAGVRVGEASPPAPMAEPHIPPIPAILPEPVAWEIRGMVAGHEQRLNLCTVADLARSRTVYYREAGYSNVKVYGLARIEQPVIDTTEPTTPTDVVHPTREDYEEMGRAVAARMMIADKPRRWTWAHILLIGYAVAGVLTFLAFIGAI